MPTREQKKILRAACEGMLTGKKFKMTAAAVYQLKGDKLCDFSERNWWKVTGVNVEGTIDIEGTDGATFYTIDVNVLRFKLAN